MALAVESDSQRAELVEAKTYLSQNWEWRRMYRRTALFGLSLMAIGTVSGVPSTGAEATVPVAGAEIRFELQDTQGKTVSSADLRGRWVLAFFGYTSCPDICPTTLFDIAQALARLGPSAARVQPIFISVDPQRDTPENTSRIRERLRCAHLAADRNGRRT